MTVQELEDYLLASNVLFPTQTKFRIKFGDAAYFSLYDRTVRSIRFEVGEPIDGRIYTVVVSGVPIRLNELLMFCNPYKVSIVQS